MANIELVFIELGTVVALLGIYALAKYTLSSDESYKKKNEYKIPEDPNEGNREYKFPLSDERNVANPLYKTSLGGKRKSRRK
jgi:hypothetical protein